MDDRDDVDDIDYALEWKLRAIAVPVAFVLALAFHASPMGHHLQRTFLTMMPHEFGHAITAWLAGYPAIPSLWKTIVFDRSVVLSIVLAAGVLALLYRGWTTNRAGFLVAGVGLGALQLGLATTSAATAGAAITFGGDAGAMVIGTLFVMAFFAREGSKLRRGGLRWGLLVIGAATIVDTGATWWVARTDVSVIPYGEIEGVGLSDPTKLERAYGWSTDELVGRYVLVGTACVMVVALAYAWAVHNARTRALADA